MTDHRSPEAAIYRVWYKSPRWRAIRTDQLKREPLCRMCRPRFTPATICDHVSPHRGDETAFFAGPFQSLCKPHHDSAKQKAELAGFGAECDASGWPTDPRHPANRAR